MAHTKLRPHPGSAGRNMRVVAERHDAGHVLHLHIGELTRRAIVYRPSRLSARPGLVLVLHGAIASADEVLRLTDFNVQADRLGWVVAYPQAHRPSIGGGWDSFACCPQQGVDDLAFIVSLLDRLQSEHGLDHGGAFVTGFSRGGMMAHRLGCQLSDRVAGIAAVAGNLGDPVGRIDHEAWRPSRPVAVMVVHGDADLNVPIQGGASPLYPEQIRYAALDQVMGAWRVWNGCDSSAPTERVEGSVLCRTWSCGGRPVELRLVIGGSHTWPGPRHRLGTPDAGFDASLVIAEFFRSL